MVIVDEYGHNGPVWTNLTINLPTFWLDMSYVHLFGMRCMLSDVVTDVI